MDGQCNKEAIMRKGYNILDKNKILSLIDKDEDDLEK